MFTRVLLAQAIKYVRERWVILEQTYNKNLSQFWIQHYPNLFITFKNLHKEQTPLAHTTLFNQYL